MEAPCLASSLAIDRPMPRPAPVTTATLWASMAVASVASSRGAMCSCAHDGAAICLQRAVAGLQSYSRRNAVGIANGELCDVLQHKACELLAGMPSVLQAARSVALSLLRGFPTRGTVSLVAKMKSRHEQFTHLFSGSHGRRALGPTPPPPTGSRTPARARTPGRARTADRGDAPDAM